MADGSRPPDKDIHLLECPICLERFQQPKSLPCLHTFCQDCLGTYITKELSDKISSALSFPCPVCRNMTFPVNQAEAVDKWAEQFPTNTVIKDIIQLNEDSSKPLFCRPCQTKGNTASPAKVWCKKMDISFCETCRVQLHDVLHTDCGILDLTVQDITKYKHDRSPPPCDQHGKELTWYCEDHQRLCCHECVIEDHRRCGEVTKTTEYFEKLNAGPQLKDMDATLKKGAEVMDNLVKVFDKQLQILIENQDSALKSITALRRQVDIRLDNLQKEITDQLIEMFKEEKSELEATLRQSQHLMNGMRNSLKSITTAVEENNHIETIMLYQRGKAEVESCKAIVTEINKTFKSVSMEHQFVPTQSIIRGDAMGKIVVIKKSQCIPGNPGNFPLLSQCHVKEMGKFNIKSPRDKQDCYAYGVVYLQGGQVVVSDENNRKLKLFTDKGQYQDELAVEGCPGDMCLVDNNTVAVCICWPGHVCVVKVEESNLSLISRINMSNGKDCCGITYRDGKFVVGTGEGEVYNVTQGREAELLHKYNNTCWFLTVDPVNNDLLVSASNNTPGEVAVSRLSANKHRADVMKVGVVSGARGIDVDREGNIYVCGMDSHNVVQMSGDGTHARELLTSSEGVDNPRGIAVCDDTFIVTNTSDTDQKNFICVFKLY